MNRKKLYAALTAAATFATTFASMPQFMTATQAAEVTYDSFDVSFDGWHGTDPANNIVPVEGAGVGGTRAMALTGRKSADEGAQSTKGLYLFGGVKYNYSMNVYSESDETFRLNLRYIDEETEKSTTVELASVRVKGGEWTEIAKSFKAPKDTYEYELTLTTNSTNDFMFDDFKITTKKSTADVLAAPAGKSLKDEFAKYFRVGNILNGGTVKNSGITGNFLKDYNAVECENETKPDATLVQNGSTDTNIKVSLNSCAAICDFAQKNGLGFRGHTLVWHSQSPEWFFKSNGNWCSKQQQEQRLESYIKNMFNAYATQYPNLDLYAYDVCNEIINDGTANQGGVRPGGTGNGQSKWVSVYGDNSFVELAFKYARQYAPKNCKLFYNDYNEFAGDKKNCIKNTILKPLAQKGYLDGMGMQSHISAAASNAWGDTNSYLAAMDDYLSLGIDVQVTELDISVENGKFSAQDQANKYKAIFQHAVDWNKKHPNGPNVTLIQIWGPNDANSWLSSGSNALLYDRNNQPKLAYTTLMSLLPDSEWGTGIPYTGPGGGSYTPPEPPKVDERGYWFEHTFEEGTNSWSGRGSASVDKASGGYDSSNALYVTGRTASWNGASLALDSQAFKAGESYSFSVNAMSKTGDTTGFKFSLQYTDSSGETKYDEIASGVAPAGEWIQLANTSYKLPSGGSSFQIYVETNDDSTNDFYIDCAVGAVEGTKVNGPTPSAIVTTATTTTSQLTTTTTTTAVPTFDTKYGDVNKDGNVTVADAVAILQYVANKDKYNLDAEALDNADVYMRGDGVTAKDALSIQKLDANRIDKLPESYMEGFGERTNMTTTTTTTTAQTTTTSKNSSSSGSFNIATIANDMVNSSPNNFNAKRGGVDYGKVEKVSYQSKDGGGQKSMNVILPAGYSANKKYPVFYVLHGIGGNEDSMVQMGMQTMLGNLLADGLCEPMIIVSLNMVTGGSGGNMFSQEFMRHNDLIREDIKNSVMPYMEQHYSVATGRENTAISGFSLGGREALYTGITDSENYGYVGGACPAPGIFPTRDMYMEHEGSLKQESQFKPSTMPFLILISAAQNDGVVGTYPESYHKALQNNNVEHIWNVIPSGDHGNKTVDPHMYNFMRYLFKA